MTERKGTPDILGAILGSSTPTDQSAPAMPAASVVPPAVPAAPVPGFRTERAPRTAAPRQTQWEYLVVSFHEQNGWHARFINGHELDNWQRGPQLHDVLIARRRRLGVDQRCEERSAVRHDGSDSGVFQTTTMTSPTPSLS
jgi:hypothetical protein